MCFLHASKIVWAILKLGHSGDSMLFFPRISQEREITKKHWKEMPAKAEWKTSKLDLPKKKKKKKMYNEKMPAWK